MNEHLALCFAAFGIGAIHALEPGHGKAIMIGTLVGSRRTWRDPLLLAGWTAAGHILGVLLFAGASFLFAHQFVEGSAKFYFETGIGLCVSAVGLFLLYGLSRQNRAIHTSCSCCYSGEHGRSAGVGARHLGFIGVLVGLVPCPSALALAASTVSLDSVSQVVSVALLFGLGVAATLLVIGISITLSSKQFLCSPELMNIARYGKYIGPCSLVVLGGFIILHAGQHGH